MPEAIYQDPRLVALYDALNPWSRDTDFYLDLAGDTPLRILDIGCGTGLLTAALASRGHTVAGLDPAPAMIDAAQRRPRGDSVRWVCGLASDAPAGPYDLAVMTGHAFQTLLSDEMIADLMHEVHRRLAAGGRFAFETRNPILESWKAWTPEQTRRIIEVDGSGRLETWHELQDVAGEIVRFDSTYRFQTGETLISKGALRFPGQALIDDLLRQAGFAATRWFGDWDGGPVTPTSHELIAVAKA